MAPLRNGDARRAFRRRPPALGPRRAAPRSRGTVAADVLTETIRREIGALFGLYVDEVAVVRSGTVGRTTSGKVQRAATKARYESGELGGDGSYRQAAGE